ncbi:hypothetical protein AbraIFM66950_001077 [Aspergillus brasiliensis]|nr:hypothetical protein AbraIFM66950_001077 [Aspergillus brasiliensis]
MDIEGIDPPSSGHKSYPSIPGDREGIEVEAELLKILESHPRIVASKGLNEYGLVLQYATNGNVYDRLTSDLHTPFD